MSDPKYPVERADLTRLPFRALAVVAKVIESGDRKYQAGDWIMAPQRIDGRRDLNSALRHIAEYVDGKDVDEDSGESPLAHAAARLLFLIEREERGIKGGGWRIGKGEEARIPILSEIDPVGRFPLTPRVCGAGGIDFGGRVALCGLDEGHSAPHAFTVPDITDARGIRFCMAFRDRGGKPFLCAFDEGHEGPHSFTVQADHRAEAES